MHRALERRPHAPGVCTERTPSRIRHRVVICRPRAYARARGILFPLVSGEIGATERLRTAFARSDRDAVTCGVACVRFGTLPLAVRSVVL